MKIEYFGYFCEVVESQGISLAAQKMYISQQGLSKALNVIESELGTTLLNRNRNSGSVSLTAEGQIFYDYASSIWKEYSRMCTVFQSLKGKQSGGEKVTICGTKFLLNNVLTPVFHTMTATGKELPQILEKSIDEIFSGLDSQPSNQLNIVNIPEYTFSEIKRNSDLCFVALYSSSLMAYLYKNNPMSRTTQRPTRTANPATKKTPPRPRHKEGGRYDLCRRRTDQAQRRCPRPPARPPSRSQ